MKKVFFLFLSLIFLVGCTSKGEQSNCSKTRKPKNVIYLIGDGMGLNQLYAGMTANGGTLNIERCTHTGLAKTYSANSYITDSAAGGTALATGSKTNNGMIGMNADSVAVKSVLSAAEEAGMATGLVATVRITHATPASFYAHQISRNMYEEIAAEMLTSGVDFFVGGGRKNFEVRKDSLNYSDSLRNVDYNIVYSIDSVQAPVLLPFGALCADSDMPQARERGNFLPQAVDLAIKSLDARADGFFLMVEGSQIDYQGHGNNTEGVVDEVLDFDRAIKVALDFAERDGETLVVITADHETGGMTILNGSYADSTVVAQFNTGGHTGTMVPIYSFGPCADQFTGIMENTEIPLRIKSILGL
jgi:alkaline phosphatase